MKEIGSKRQFTSLNRVETKAPRLSVKGRTINGIKKPLKRSCLLTIACADPNFVVIDLEDLHIVSLPASR